MLTTDYLVIGAGAASLSFVDTLLTELPDTKITIVDKHDAPGGHWNDAYGHVQLHQPSLLYGVASQQLEGNWLKLMTTKFTLPWNHRASKTEILNHYSMLLEKWIAQGSVKYYPNCVYDFEKKPPPTSDLHSFYALDGSFTCNIRVKEKLVNGTLGECRVPSKCPPAFPIDQGINVMTPNQLFDKHQTDKSSKRGTSHFACISNSATAPVNNYVVMGCGKTAMDTVVFLQRTMGVNPHDITWVVPNDVWIIRREGPGGPSSWPVALLKSDLDVNKAGLLLEKQGAFVRLDEKVLPTKYRFPIVGEDELRYMRNVTNVIRKGRITSISCNKDGSSIVRFQKGEPFQFSPNHIFVHCTSPGPFNGNTKVELFPSDKEMNLWLLFAPPIPISMSCLAVLEGRRRKGLLDLDFGRKLLSTTEDLSDNEILNALITGYRFADDMTSNPSQQLETLTVISKFLCLFDKDPMAGYKWMSGNRLSIFSIPNQKCGVYETMKFMSSKRDVLRLSDTDADMLSLMEEKLKPLEGK